MGMEEIKTNTTFNLEEYELYNEHFRNPYRKEGKVYRKKVTEDENGVTFEYLTVFNDGTTESTQEKKFNPTEEDFKTILHFITDLNDPEDPDYERFNEYFEEDGQILRNVNLEQVKRYYEAHPEEGWEIAGYAKFKEENTDILNYTADELYMCSEVVKWVAANLN